MRIEGRVVLVFGVSLTVGLSLDDGTLVYIVKP